MLTKNQLSLTVTITIIGLAIAYLLHVPLVFGFVLGLFTLIAFSLRSGTAWSVIARNMWIGIKHTKEVIWILALVGLVIPTWTASGTIPYMIDKGISFINPSYFLTFSFLLSAIISMLLGTSTGTLSSVGIPLVGIGLLLQIPLPLAAGALVSGAFVGDRTSPFSSANQLVAASAGVSVKTQFQSLLPTTVGALVLSIVFFLSKDLSGSWHYSEIASLKPQFDRGYHYTPWLVLPVLILLSSILLRLKSKYGFLLSIAFAIVLGTLLQHIGFRDWLHYIWLGYQSTTIASLHTKGLSSMIELIVLIGLAGAYNGILEESRVLQPYMQKLLGDKSSTLFGATVRTSLLGLGLGLVACTQTLPIMMTGRSLLPFWEKRYLRSHLARVVADSSLIFAAMVPWNMLAIVCGTIVGVPVEQYVICAPFLWALPVCTLLWSFWIGQKQSQKEMLKKC
ncbi:Na+/H+ antiporter NhaC family protein [Paenibacillus sp. GCM10027628]|uniref:Na+/H+ antiporter NhaC family protein n=1 Tax=Paenibacillus sp. GCM10027628 TaxID=3273413 RepID=UPI00363FB348